MNTEKSSPTILPSSSECPSSSSSSSSSSLSSSSTLSNLFQFFNHLEKLKSTPRKGWLRYAIPLPQVESIADHMYRLSMMCMQLHDPQLDKLACLELALVHDVAESIVGDITPHCGISKQEKYLLEKSAIHDLHTLLPTFSATHLVDLWTQYEAQATPEARVVHQLDRFEMLFQAFEYEQHFPVDLSSFFRSVPAAFFVHPDISAWYLELTRQRNGWWKGKMEARGEEKSGTGNEEG